MKKKLLPLLVLLLLFGGMARGQGMLTDSSASRNALPTKSDTISSPEYKHSVGLINGYSLVPGVTYKYCISRHFSLETDLYPKLLITGKLLSEKANHIFLPLIELSENALFQNLFAVKGNVSYQYVFGGGINGALQPFFPVIWKIGINAFVGIEFSFLDRPVSLQVDIRPGYGLLLRSAKTIEEQRHFWNLLTPGLRRNPQSCFDWAVNFSIRFHKKINHYEK